MLVSSDYEPVITTHNFIPIPFALHGDLPQTIKQLTISISASFSAGKINTISTVPFDTVETIALHGDLHPHNPLGCKYVCHEDM